VIIPTGPVSSEVNKQMWHQHADHECAGATNQPVESTVSAAPGAGVVAPDNLSATRGESS